MQDLSEVMRAQSPSGVAELLGMHHNMLQGHQDMLADHDGMLQQHEDMLHSHTGALQDHDSQLDQQNQRIARLEESQHVNSITAE